MSASEQEPHGPFQDARGAHFVVSAEGVDGPLDTVQLLKCQFRTPSLIKNEDLRPTCSLFSPSTPSWWSNRSFIS